MALVYFDTETTGLEITSDVVELASITLLDDGTKIKYCERFKPRSTIPSDVTRIHGISDADVINCIDSQTGIIQWFNHIIHQTDGLVVFAAHNMKYDAGILDKYLPQFKQYPQICTLRLARILLPGLPNYKLESLYHGINSDIIYEAHHADNDVAMGLELLLSLSDYAGKDYIDIVTEYSKPTQLTTMTYGKHNGKPFTEIPQDYIDWLFNNTDDIDIIYTIKQLRGIQ
jgi:DNA polymerase III alpha subunit (gram-positive type)